MNLRLPPGMVKAKRVAASAFLGLVFALACGAQTQRANGPSSEEQEPVR